MKHLLYCLNFIIPLVLVPIGVSCTSNEQEHRQFLEREVLQLHDQAMQKMDKINQIRMNLTSIRKATSTPESDTTISNPLINQIMALNKADDAMMNWMHQYRAPDSLSHQEAINYLQEQLVKIKAVKIQVDSTLVNAQKTQKKYE